MSTEIFFTSNPSDFQKLEGLYIRERQPPGFIRGADLSWTGIAGKAVRGPTTPQVITDSGEFEAIYGTRAYGDNKGTLVGEMWASMLNKPFGTVVTRRVVAAAATAASHQFSDAAPAVIVTVTASSVGAWGLEITAAVETASDADANHFNLRIAYQGKEFLGVNCNVSGSNNNLASIFGTDVTRLVDVTKTASGRPVNIAATALATGGSDGTVAASDYNLGIDDLAGYSGVAVVMVPDLIGTPATFYAHLVTTVAAANDRIFLARAMPDGLSVANEITAQLAAVTTTSDRLIWCHNETFTIDPVVDTEIAQGAHAWMAAILSQTDVDVHPGSYETRAFLAGITRVNNVALSRGDLILLKNAGISALEKVKGGFQFRSGVTTSLTAGLTEITRRRMADFLQLSAADRLKTYVKGKNTETIRAQMAAELTAFSNQLKRAERVIEDFEIDQVSVNSDDLRAQGEEHILWRVKLIGHMLYLVFETEIATGTVIQKS
jgi:hypothetical protein